MLNKRQILHDFFNGKTNKLIQSNKNTLPQIIILESKNEDFVEAYFEGKLIEILFYEVGTFLEKIPKNNLVLDYARPITREEIEKRET